MRHEHLVVTVESGTKARIEDDLDPGETVEAWVADAIEGKLASEGATGRETADRKAGDDRIGESDDSEDGGECDEREDADDYDEGFEYVDDCAI